ncbi:MAG: bifunctional phosphopantothenoylcysteine decarboxylase/phosphopantothenate--cysteine ligase CoaBC [Pseudomonadota bacterium]|nr:bifunctional phosphopantothenoylcysteine decarboxylase/phosphopantothenate--cysteine ligase CoaBC [Pseudomonadota bacterium]
MDSIRIVLGVSGGIAAYKTPELVRRLKDRGADVQVVMTRSAHEFVTETSLQAVSGRQVRENLWDREAEAAMGHIELARWADLVLIVPATAEIMSRLASGGAGDLLSTLCLATEAPVAIAPAMNHVMWSNPAVQENRRTLKQRGMRILGPASGDQVCGESGSGRMLEPDDIVSAVMSPSAVPDTPLAGRTVMITAGPTHEPIDPVRFMSNRSSGKMGYALAAAVREAGADVILVSGPVIIPRPSYVDVVDVESAEEMYGAVHERVGEADIFIGVAAVSDYRSENIEAEKIKKSGDGLSLDLIQSRDILASVAALEERPFTVGFAAETEKLREHALAKMKRKRLDMIVANLVGRDKAFQSDRNAVEVFWPGDMQSLPEADKHSLARGIVELIVQRYEVAQDVETQPKPPIRIVGD